MMILITNQGLTPDPISMNSLFSFPSDLIWTPVIDFLPDVTTAIKLEY